jgi:hypothetical protein
MTQEEIAPKETVLEGPVLEELVPKETAREESGALLMQGVPVQAKMVIIDTPQDDDDHVEVAEAHLGPAAGGEASAPVSLGAFSWY